MFALILGIVRYIAGYENMMVYVILNALGGFLLGHRRDPAIPIHP